MSVATAARASDDAALVRRLQTGYARADPRGLPSPGRAIPASPVPTSGGQGADPPGAAGCCQRDLGAGLAAHRRLRVPRHRYLAWLRAIANHVAQEQFKRRFFGNRARCGATRIGRSRRPRSRGLRSPTPHRPRAPGDTPAGARHRARDYRIVIQAYFFAEQTTAEIMACHGWSRSKVYTTKFRALAWLRERLIECALTNDMPTLH